MGWQLCGPLRFIESLKKARFCCDFRLEMRGVSGSLKLNNLTYSSPILSKPLQAFLTFSVR